MEKSKRFFQKSVFVCVLIAFMAFTSSVWGEVSPAQQDKLNQINDLIAQIGAPGLTDQQKVEIIAQILSMTEGLANEAKISGNTDLAMEVMGIINKVTDILFGIIDTSSENVTVLAQLGELSKTAAQITLTVAETAKAANNAALAQQTMTAANNLNNVNNQIATAAQNLASTSADVNTVNSANALVQNVNASQSITNDVIQTSASAGASFSPGAGRTPAPPAPADQSSGGGGTPPDDNEPASPK